MTFIEADSDKIDAAGDAVWADGFTAGVSHGAQNADAVITAENARLKERIASLEEAVELYNKTLREERTRLAEMTAERDRWAQKMREYEERIRHAEEVLRGSFSPPEIDEIRKARGLEPLSWKVKT